MMKYKAICFDIDGTLYPPKQMHRRLAAMWLRHPLFLARYMKMRSTFRKMQDGFEDNVPFRKREASIIGCSQERLQKCFYGPLERKYRTIKPFDGVRETFLYLKSKGIKIGVFSDFPLFDKLEKLGVADLVDVALSSDDVGFLKPSVHPFEILLYKLGVEPSETLYIGDEYKKDIVGASKARVDAYIVRDWKSLDGYIRELK